MTSRIQDLKLTDEFERQLAHRCPPEGGYHQEPARLDRWLPVLVAVAVSLATAAVVF